jgi:hypothetical protein
MSNDTGFLARWSHRKHDAATDKIKKSTAEDAPGDVASASGTYAAPLAPGESKQLFDPARLPPIESIGAKSDIHSFLEPGVPADLTRAALRRAWSLDPAVHDFVGLSENSWNFNEPNEMIGFGPIDRQEVGRLLARLLGGPGAPASDTVLPPLISAPGDDVEKTAKSNAVENGDAGSRPAGER